MLLKSLSIVTNWFRLSCATRHTQKLALVLQLKWSLILFICLDQHLLRGLLIFQPFNRQILLRSATTGHHLLHRHLLHRCSRRELRGHFARFDHVFKLFICQVLRIYDWLASQRRKMLHLAICVLTGFASKVFFLSWTLVCWRFWVGKRGWRTI